MSKRVSKSTMSLSSSAGRMPALVVAYKNAMRAVFGTKVYVRKEEYKRFKKRQQELESIGASYIRYAMCTAKTWKRWCKDNGMAKSMPVNLFCGKKTLEMHERLLERLTVLITTTDEDDYDNAVYGEMCAALTYIGYGGDVAFVDACRGIGVSTRCAEDVFEEALDALAKRFHVPSAMSYDDIIDVRRKHDSYDIQGD